MLFSICIMKKFQVSIFSVVVHYFANKRKQNWTQAPPAAPFRGEEGRGGRGWTGGGCWRCCLYCASRRHNRTSNIPKLQKCKCRIFHFSKFIFSKCFFSLFSIFFFFSILALFSPGPEMLFLPPFPSPPSLLARLSCFFLRMTHYVYCAMYKKKNDEKNRLPRF